MQKAQGSGIREAEEHQAGSQVFPFPEYAPQIQILKPSVLLNCSVFKTR